MTLESEDLKRLYERYARALLAFFQRRVNDPELAIDLMSDTFMLALERRDQFRGMTDKQLSGWLWSIGQSVLREHERRGETAARNSSRLSRERRGLTDREIERIEELASSENLRAAVARSLERLPVEQRDAVRLRVVEGLSYAEIARQLGITASGTRTRVTRAMRDLRGMLERDFEREEGGSI
ncbi:MAG TPA: sigma-70 family RNA polymerase sigma factor [Solirubrobacterales bacterium]